MTNRSIPTHTIALPEYTREAAESDYRAVGAVLDRVIETHFAGRDLVCGRLGSKVILGLGLRPS